MDSRDLAKLKPEAGAAQVKPRFSKYFKDYFLEKFQKAVAIPVILGIAFFGYVGATGTFKQLKDGSGVYTISVAGMKSRIVLPSFIEVKENYGKMQRVCRYVADSFDFHNPRVVKTLENLQVVIAPGSGEDRQFKGLHVPGEGKVYIYDTSNSADTNHEFNHAYLFWSASDEERKIIAQKFNELYRIFPPKFGEYLEREYCNNGKDIGKLYTGMQQKFGLDARETMAMAEVVGAWMPIYGFAKEKGSLESPHLNYDALSEAFAYYGEGRIPEPLVAAYKGILSESRLKDVEPLSREAIETARQAFRGKIGPRI